MTFVSFEFVVFLAITLAVYFSVPHRARNAVLLVASYIFYGWWDFRFLGLLIISSLVDYLCGRLIGQSTEEADRRKILAVSIVFSLGTLCIFKYFDFFMTELQSAMGGLGVKVDVPLLRVILPIGISFYTFQTMSYSIDIYQRKLQPVTRLIDFLAFVSFFPHLVAGPILRARDLLPQMLRQRQVTAEMISSGVALMMWGFFKKIAIADNMGVYADTIYGQAKPNGVAVILATCAFAFQIYCDFSGYSDIARGCARLLGFNIMVNFNLPFLAANPSDFWRRWHISLSTWIRDYFYFPLAASQRSAFRIGVITVFVMAVMGLWHGAADHFIMWGVFHGLMLQIYRGANAVNGRYLGLTWRPRSSLHWLSVVLYFSINLFGWMLFRVTTLSGQMLPMLKQVVHDFSPASMQWGQLGVLPMLAAFLMLAELIQYRLNDLEPWLRLPPPLQAAALAAGCSAIALLAPEKTLGFIYFAF